MRNNPVLWRIAEWLDVCIADKTGVESCDMDDDYMNELYDKAAVLYAKIIQNEFTGDDNHAD